MSAKSTIIPEAKVVLIGTTNVGKTSIVTRVTSGEFDPEIKNTVGACYATKSFSVDNQTIKLQIWDTAGQERFKTLVPMYYRGAVVAVVVFSVTEEATLEEIDFYANGVLSVANPPPAIIIVANKIDLESERVISREKGEEYARKFNAEYFEISAATGVGIEPMIKRIAEISFNRIKDDVQKSDVVIIKKNDKKQKSCC